jgi:energy-coupling factor transporter ATP-binding protein EcfA2
MGLSRRELTQKYDNIVQFAELERFIDTPLKRYSSGMQARLAFSVAVHLDPEVLLIDEVLSVGDYAFQRKSFDRILEFKKRGTHIVFVSHNLGSVATLCDRTLWLRRGQVVQIGRTPDVIEAYLRESDAEAAASASDTGGEMIGGQGDVRIERAEFLDQFEHPEDTFKFQDPIRIRLHYHARVPVEQPYIQLGVSCDRGHLFMANMFFDDCRPDVLTGRGYIDCCFENLPLLPGTYQVTCSVLRDYRVRYQEVFNAGTFKVQSLLPEYGYRGELAVAVSRDSCPVYVPYYWDFAGTKSDRDTASRQAITA